MRLATILTKALLTLTLTTLAASGADKTLGTWKLNVERSKYTPAPFPLKSLTVVRESSDGAVKVTTTGEQANGTPVNITYMTKYDGSAATVEGSNPLYDSISVTRVDDNTLTDERKKDGGPYQATGRTVVSDNGKTMTTTTKGTNANGKEFVSVFVFEKQ